MKKNRIKDLTLCALFAAFLAVTAQICIPLPSGVSLTLQSFAVALCGATLGARKGVISTAVYIVLGAVGIPVFSSFTGGIGVLAGASGGFIIGFLPLCAFCARWRQNETRTVSALKAAVGLVLCYLLGTIWFHFVTGNGIISSLVLSCAPFVLKDIIIIGAALEIGRLLERKI